MIQPHEPFEHLANLRKGNFDDCKIFVGGLNLNTSVDQLMNTFAGYGQITDAAPWQLHGSFGWWFVVYILSTVTKLNFTQNFFLITQNIILYALRRNRANFLGVHLYSVQASTCSRHSCEHTVGHGWVDIFGLPRAVSQSWWVSGNHDGQDDWQTPWFWLHCLRKFWLCDSSASGTRSSELWRGCSVSLLLGPLLMPRILGIPGWRHNAVIIKVSSLMLMFISYIWGIFFPDSWGQTSCERQVGRRQAREAYDLRDSVGGCGPWIHDNHDT